MAVRFLFVDEKYADTNAAVRYRVISVAGVLVDPALHAAFRERYHLSISDAVERPHDQLGTMPRIHASELFKELGVSDDRKLHFFERVVDLIVEFGIKVYRCGYIADDFMNKHFGKHALIPSLCYFGILGALGPELKEHQIWPVIEIDRSPAQDQHFAQNSLHHDHLWVHRPDISWSVDRSNLGEVLYSTKSSSYGSMADIVVYLLHTRWLDGHQQVHSDFGKALSEIAAKLAPAVALDETIKMNYGSA